MNTIENANKARTLLLLISQSEVKDYKTSSTKINSHTSIELIDTFGTIEISFQNPAVSGHYERRGSEKHSFDSGNLLIKQIENRQPEVPLIKELTITPSIELRKKVISSRKIKNEDDESKDNIVTPKKSKLIHNAIHYLKGLSEDYINRKKFKRKNSKKERSQKIKKSKSINRKYYINREIQHIKVISNQSINHNNINLDADRTTLKTRRQLTDNKLSSIIDKIKKSHNQINCFLGNPSTKIYNKQKNKGHQFLFQPKIL